MAASREFINSVDPTEVDESIENVLVTADHFEAALDEVGPSVDADLRERYEEVEEQFERAEPVENEPTVSRTFQ
jgi:hypothetical protein